MMYDWRRRIFSRWRHGPIEWLSKGTYLANLQSTARSRRRHFFGGIVLVVTIWLLVDVIGKFWFLLGGQLSQSRGLEDSLRQFAMRHVRTIRRAAGAQRQRNPGDVDWRSFHVGAIRARGEGSARRSHIPNRSWTR